MSTSDLGELVERLEVLAAEVDTFEPYVRDTVLELIDAIELLHRSAVAELGDALGDQVGELCDAHPAIMWLFEAYDAAAADDAGPAPRRTLPIHPGG